MLLRGLVTMQNHSEMRSAPPTPPAPRNGTAGRPGGGSGRGGGRPPQGPSAWLRPRIWWLIFLVVLVANYAAMTVIMPDSGSQRVQIPYSEFVKQVQAGNVVEVSTS